jgi:hypothetical protein
MTLVSGTTKNGVAAEGEGRESSNSSLRAHKVHTIGLLLDGRTMT